MKYFRDNWRTAITSAVLTAVALTAFGRPTFGGEAASRYEQVQPGGETTAPAPRETQGDDPLPRVAIVASASASVNDALFTDPRDKLLDTGRFREVTIIHAGETTPELADLLLFDALLVWSNLEFEDSELLGERLADYVDVGRGVVLAVYANTSDGIDRFLGGRWATADYSVIAPQQGSTSGPATLGAILQPGHELIYKVDTFSGGLLSSRPTTTSINPNGALIAAWSDGKPLVAVRDDLAGRRVDLGFYPPSSDAVFFLWDAATDGDVLLANALQYAAGRSPTDVEVLLVPRLTPALLDVTTDVASLNNVLFPANCGALSSFVLEIWVSDVGETNTGMLGIYLDLSFDPQVLQAVGLVHSAAMPILVEGAIDNPAGAVTDFGGFTFTPVGIEPSWVRVGYVQMSAVSESQAIVTSTLGIGGVAVSGRPAPSPNEIEFGIAHVFPSVHGDSDEDCDVDLADFAQFQRCFGEIELGPDCIFGDFDASGSIDGTDYAGFSVIFSGPGEAP